jgi:hypothetical protein
VMLAIDLFRGRRWQAAPRQQARGCHLVGG